MSKLRCNLCQTFKTLPRVYQSIQRCLVSQTSACSPHICRQERRDDSRQSVECFDTNPLLYLLPTRLIPGTLFKKSIFYFKKNFLILQKYRNEYNISSNHPRSSLYFQYTFYAREDIKIIFNCATKFLTLIFPFEKKKFVYKLKLQLRCNSIEENYLKIIFPFEQKIFERA